MLKTSHSEWKFPQILSKNLLKLILKSWKIRDDTNNNLSR